MVQPVFPGAYTPIRPGSMVDGTWVAGPGGIGAAGGYNPGGGQFAIPDTAPGFMGIPWYGYGENPLEVYDHYGYGPGGNAPVPLKEEVASYYPSYVQNLLQGHTTSSYDHEELTKEEGGNPEHEQLVPIVPGTSAYGGEGINIAELTPEVMSYYPPQLQEIIWRHGGGKWPWEEGYTGEGGYVGGGDDLPDIDTGENLPPHWWPMGGGDDGPGGTGGGGTVYPLPPGPGPTDFPPTPGPVEDEWPNIVKDSWSRLYSQALQPNPMWGGGPASWLMGSPISNSWLGGHQIMANDPWSSLVAQQTPNAYDAYWNMVNPLTPAANSGLVFQGHPGGGEWVDENAISQITPVARASDPVVDQAAEPVVGQAAEPAAGGQTFLEQYGMSQEAYNTAVNNFNQQMMSGFQDFTGVSPEQYAMAQDPSGWRGDQTFGERVGMSQEAYNTARNNAWQTYKQGKPVLGPGAQGGAYGTYDPTIGAQGSQGAQQAAAAPDAAAAAATPAPVTGTGQITPGALGSAGTAAQFNLAQNPNAWRGAQYGSPSPMTPGTMGAGDSAVAAGSGQITPGTMGGDGTAAQFTQTQTPDNWRGTQFGSPSPITPGTLGGGQTPFFGAPSPITPGTMGGDGASQPSPITPGTMGGGGTSQPSPITPGTMGGMGAAQPSPITPGIMGGGTSQPSPITVRMGGAPQEQWNHQGMFSRQGTYPQNQIAPGSFGSVASMPGSPSPITPGRMGGGNYRGMFSMHRPNGTRPVYGSQQRKGF